MQNTESEAQEPAIKRNPLIKKVEKVPLKITKSFTLETSENGMYWKKYTNDKGLPQVGL